MGAETRRLSFLDEPELKFCERSLSLQERLQDSDPLVPLRQDRLSARRALAFS